MPDPEALTSHPFETFGPWFQTPLRLGRDRSVRGVLDALNAHPLAGDRQAQDHVMPARRYLENPKRFRVWAENQDNFHCYVRAEQADETDPPVYLETSLDLVADAGIAPSDVVDGDSVLVCSRFTQFLWHMLAHHICLRLEKSPLFAASVTGLQFDQDVKVALDGSFVNPLGREFPAGFTSFVGVDAICIPDWGAAFRHDEARLAFGARFNVPVDGVWSDAG